MKNPLRKQASDFIFRNNVAILFIALCTFFYFTSGTDLNFLLPELFTRIGRNTFLVLSLLIPVVAGIGLNFGIVIGAIAAQIAIFLTVLWGFKGFAGLMLCVVICTPLAIFFGWLIGKLFNSMKGAEMIGGLVAGYFSDGLYQFLFLFVMGGIIPISNKKLMISTGIGVQNTITLSDNIKYALDDVPMIQIIDVAFWVALAVIAIRFIIRLVKKQDLQIKRSVVALVATGAVYGLTFVPPITKFLSTTRLILLDAIVIGVVGTIVYAVVGIINKKAVKKEAGAPKREIGFIVISLLIYAATYIPVLEEALLLVRIPVLTFLCIGALCLFIPWFINTRLGQNMRTVGHSRDVANSAGIDVDRTRIIAMIMSTVLASYGQLISLQNIGTMATYGSHNQVGLYAIAALLVGGASVHRASVKQAIVGIILFHTLFILSPLAGKTLFGNAQIGEYFRVFVAYGVIAVALALHAWQTNVQKQRATE